MMGHLLAGLARRHDLALLCLRGRDEPPVDPEIAAACVLCEELPRPGGTRSRALRERVGKHLRAARAAATRTPRWASWCNVPRLTQRVREVARALAPEVVQFEYHVMGQYA